MASEAEESVPMLEQTADTAVDSVTGSNGNGSEDLKPEQVSIFCRAG